MKQITDYHYDRLLSFVPNAELERMLRDGEISQNDAREETARRFEKILRSASFFNPLAPPDRGFEWHGSVKWPWFTARRKGYLLEQRVDELAARVAHLEQHLLSGLLREAERK